jgi:hypothetical protein
MYIFRIVIDANLINARQGIAAMNSLEALHKAGLVEIFQTSTLPVEMRPYPPGHQKARQYATLGSSSSVYLTKGNVADSQPGTSGRKSKDWVIHQLIFGEPALEEKKRLNDMRDALHVDQANQHDADFFITHERRILDASPKLAAQGFTTRVCKAQNCLDEIIAYFERHYGTADPTALGRLLDQDGPVLLGSNSCGGTILTDVEHNEELLAFEMTDSGVAIRATLRGSNGAKLLTIQPGQRPTFEAPDAEITSEVGPSPLRIGEESARSFAVTANGTLLLAGRILQTGRLLMHDVCLYNKSGRLSVHVTRDVMKLDCVVVSAAPGS